MSNELKTEKKVLAVSMLAEGNSLRSIERMTGIHRDTIMRLAVRIGEGCATIHNDKMRGLACKHLEIDELGGFIGKKQKNVSATEYGYGDVWTFIALDADTKLIPAFTVGKRDSYHAKAFISDLAERLRNRVQISSDSLKAYADAIERGFGSNVWMNWQSLRLLPTVSPFQIRTLPGFLLVPFQCYVIERYPFREHRPRKRRR